MKSSYRCSHRGDGDAGSALSELPAGDLKVLRVGTARHCGRGQAEGGNMRRQVGARRREKLLQVVERERQLTEILSLIKG